MDPWGKEFQKWTRSTASKVRASLYNSMAPKGMASCYYTTVSWLLASCYFLVISDDDAVDVS
jgi:hypothetical protein